MPLEQFHIKMSNEEFPVETVDLTFRLGIKDGVDRRISVHKAKIYAESSRGCIAKRMQQYLRRDIPNVRYDLFLGLIMIFEFFYLNTPISINEATVNSLLLVSRGFGLFNIYHACFDHLMSTITIDNVLSCYQLALHCNNLHMEELTKRFIQENWVALIETESFLNLDADLLYHVLQWDRQCDEALVFDVLVEWVIRQSSNKQRAMANLRHELDEHMDLMDVIRFEKMSPVDLKDRLTHYNSMFTMTQFMNLLANANDDIETITWSYPLGLMDTEMSTRMRIVTDEPYSISMMAISFSNVYDEYMRPIDFEALIRIGCTAGVSIMNKNGWRTLETFNHAVEATECTTNTHTYVFPQPIRCWKTLGVDIKLVPKVGGDAYTQVYHFDYSVEQSNGRLMPMTHNLISTISQIHFQSNFNC